MGLGSTMARVGSMVAPLVRMAADVTPVLPLIIYGAAPIVSAIATCFLPETRNAPLPETVEDVQRRWGLPGGRGHRGDGQGSGGG